MGRDLIRNGVSTGMSGARFAPMLLPFFLVACNLDNGTATNTTSSSNALVSNPSSYVQKSGATMTGTLNLPGNGLVVGSNQLVLSGGNVGIGTASPGQALTVVGRVQSTAGFEFPDGSQAATSAPGGNGVLIVDEEESSGTTGSACASGSYIERVLNNVRVNTIVGASLSGNQITLPAGTYFIRASAPFSSGSYGTQHKAKFVNLTASTTVVIGTVETVSGQPNSGSRGETIAMQSSSTLVGQFTIASTSVFDLEHQCSADGVFGIAAGFGDNEVYATVEIDKQ